MAVIDPRDIFNRDEALENVGGMEELLTDLSETLIDELPKLLATADAAVVAQDAKQVNAVLHSIKGSVTPFAAQRAHTAAWKLEQAAAAGDLAQAPQLMEDLKSELELLTQALRGG